MSIILGLTAVENKLYHINDHCGLLVEINIDNWQVKKYDLNFGRYKAYSKGIAYNNKLIFAPWAGEGNSILVFDRESGQSKEIPLEENRIACDHGYFNDVMCANDRIFFIPFQYGALVEYIPDEERVEYHPEVIDFTIPQGADKNDMLYFRFAALWNNSVLLMPYTSINRVVAYDINSGECDYFDLDVGCDGLINICVNGNMIYLLSRYKGELYLYDYKNKKHIDTIRLVDGDNELFMNMVDSDDYIFILQRFAKKSYKVCKKTHEITELDLRRVYYNSDINILCADKLDKNRIFMTMRTDMPEKIGVHYIDSGETSWLNVPGLRSCEMFSYLTKGNMLYENDYFTLEDYIYEVSVKRNYDRKNNYEITDKIYQHICGYLG